MMESAMKAVGASMALQINRCACVNRFKAQRATGPAAGATSRFLYPSQLMFLANSALIRLAFLCGMFTWSDPIHAAQFFAKNPAQLSAALQEARAGDRITMADRVWTDQKIVFESHGTAKQPITLSAQTPGKVVLNGASSLQIGGRFLVVEGLCFKGNPNGPATSAVAFRSSPAEVASDCRLTQCVITDYSPADKTVGTNYVTLFGQRNRVDHCYFSDKTNRSAMLVVTFNPGDPPNYHRIDHNYFAHRPPLGFNGGEIIQIGWSQAQQVNSRTTVEFNYFEECDGEVEIITNKSCENIYRANTFVRCRGALSLRVGNRCTVEGNVFLGQRAPQTGGVHVFGEDHIIINNYFAGLTGTKEKLAVPYGEGAAIVLMNGSMLVASGEPHILQFPTGSMLHPQVKRALVAFNTFVDCTAMVDIGLAFAPFDAVSKLRPADCVLADNLVVGTAPDRLVLRSSVPENLRCEGNLVSGAATKAAPPDGFRMIRPKLIGAPDGLLRPAADSPVIGAAVGDYPSVASDIDGQPRPKTRKDVGCDQFSATPITRPPLAASDVGPAWR
jgi:poly(beta-D-mannuronate) lyase